MILMAGESKVNTCAHTPFLIPLTKVPGKNPTDHILEAHTQSRMHSFLTGRFMRIQLFTNQEKKHVKVLAVQSCPTLYDSMECSPPGSPVHGILQARALEWVAIPSSMGSSPPREWTQVSCTAGRFFMTESPGKPFINQTDKSVLFQVSLDIHVRLLCSRKVTMSLNTRCTIVGLTLGATV